MPMYDFVCSSCGTRKDHFFHRFDEAGGVVFDCTDDDCDGVAMKATVNKGGPIYEPTIERWLEQRRGHMSTYRPPPLLHSKSGAGIRRWPGKD